MTAKDSKAYMYVVECADGSLYTFASKPEAMSAEALFKKKSREKKLAYIKEHTEK